MQLKSGTTIFNDALAMFSESDRTLFRDYCYGMPIKEIAVRFHSREDVTFRKISCIKGMLYLYFLHMISEAD